MDNKGIMSSEIIILLIIIVLIIGIIASFTERSSNKVNEKISSENIEKKAIEFCDNLINNPGTPVNWQELKNKNNIIVGLSLIDENNQSVVNSVDYSKLMALSADYDKLITKNVFNDQYKSSITLSPLTGSVPIIELGDSDLENPTTVNRLVTCDFFKKYTLNSFKKDGECNHYHITTHSCNHFKVYKSWLKKMDYYLLFEPNSYNNYTWSMDSTEIPDIPKKASDDKIYLNDEIEGKILLSNNGIMFVHINQENPKAVIVAVPKDFDKSKLCYDYFVPTECNLKVQIAKV